MTKFDGRVGSVPAEEDADEVGPCSADDDLGLDGRADVKSRG